ncbi:hypothetical protein [Paucibacter soli]
MKLLCLLASMSWETLAQPLSRLPIFDSTALQAQATVDWICTPGGTRTD